jgi:acyl-CoA dehydrogenase
MVERSFSDLSMFLDPAHRLLGQELERRVGSADLTKPSTIGARLGELGLFGLTVPPAVGGTTLGSAAAMDVDVRALCVAREALAYASPLADAVFAVQGLGVHPILLAKQASKRADLLKKVVKGETVLGFALTEPEAGSDVAAMKMTARRDGSSWVLDGEKVFISNVGIAHQYVVFAHALPNAGGGGGGAGPTINIRSTSLETPRAKRAISAFLVDAKSPGLTLTEIATSSDHPLGRLVFQGCKVPADALIGEEGDGMHLALGTLEVFRTTVGAAAVGMARRALEDTVKRVKVRVQFGKRLSEMQLTQAALADMWTELDASRLLVFRAAWLKDKGEKARAQVAMAKLFATEAAQRIVDRAVQLHGGLGVVEGNAVERLYREVRPLRIYEGTSEIQRLIIGSGLLDDPPETTSGRRI